MIDLETGQSIKTKKVVLDQDKNGVIKSPIKRIKTINFIIPREIISTMKGLDRSFKLVEFSIFLNSHFDKQKEKFVIDEESLFIPEQEVSRTHIDYLEDGFNFNTVIHKHPCGCREFSNVDEEYINGNFQFSFLWVDGKIEKGISNLSVSEGIFLEVPIQSIEIQDKIEFPEIAKEKIKIAQISESEIIDIIAKTEIPTNLEETLMECRHPFFMGDFRKR